MVDDMLNIYPNPTRNELHISATKGISYTVTLTDISGQVLRTERFEGDRTTLSLANMDAGMYFVTVSSGSMMKQYRVVKL
jgi:hypothetical protein